MSALSTTYMCEASVHLNKPTEKKVLIAKTPLLIFSANAIWQNWGLNIFFPVTERLRKSNDLSSLRWQQVQELRFMTFRPVQNISGKYLQGSDFVTVKSYCSMTLHL